MTDLPHRSGRSTSSDSPRISVINCYSWYNKGDSGIVLAIVDALRQAFEKPQIAIFTLTPRVDQRAYAEFDFEVHGSIPNLTALRGGLIGKLVRLLTQLGCLTPVFLGAAFFSRILKRPVGTTRMKALFASDLVVSCGGGFLHDQHGARNLLPHVVPIVAAGLAKLPMITYSQSIGPLTSTSGRVLARMALSRMRHVFIREELSRPIVESLVPGVPITLVPDAAFALQPSHTERVAALDDELTRLARGREIVGITVRDWHFPGALDPERRYATYRESVARLIDSDEGFFVFLPQVIGPASDDDRKAAHAIQQLVSRPDASVVLDDDLSPGEVKGLIGTCSLFIGTRFHSSIFALSSGVPTLAISYLPKADGIMRELGLSEWVIPIEEVSADGLIAGLRQLRERQTQIREHLGSLTESVREQATVPAKWLAAYARAENRV